MAARFRNYPVVGTKSVEVISDSQPEPRSNDQLCTSYGQYSHTNAALIANSLNMAHELRKLQPSATKKQMLEIINKYR